MEGYKYSLQELANIIDNEGGLEYTLMSYLNPNDIEDQEVRDLSRAVVYCLERIYALIPEPKEPVRD